MPTVQARISNDEHNYLKQRKEKQNMTISDSLRLGIKFLQITDILQPVFERFYGEKISPILQSKVGEVGEQLKSVMLPDDVQEMRLRMQELGSEVLRIMRTSQKKRGRPAGSARV
jgi:hypothetical protein